MALDLPTIVADFARGVEVADAARPVAVNQRSGESYRPGIGPHSEADAIALVMQALTAAQPEKYGHFQTGVPYPGSSRQKCDLCLGMLPLWDWAIEIKMLRFLGDNAKPNDNILMHILSPYASHRSALTDCKKLRESGLSGRKAVLIYGFEDASWPLEPAIAAFECLAQAQGPLGARQTAEFSGLVHPVHARGWVFAWEVHTSRATGS